MFKAATRSAVVVTPWSVDLVRIALAVAVALLPTVLTVALVVSLFGTDLLAFTPQWSDELAYHHQIATFARAGFHGGYYAIEEGTAPAAFTHFGPHGPAFAMLYGSIGALVGWPLYAGPLVNIAVLTMSLAFFIAVTRPDPRHLVLLGAIVATSWWLLLLMPTVMQETLHASIGIVVAALLARLMLADSSRRGGWLAGLLGVLLIASAVRPTWWIIAPAVLVVALLDRPWRLVGAAVAIAVVVQALLWIGWRALAVPIPQAPLEGLGLLNPEIWMAMARRIAVIVRTNTTVLTHWWTIPESAFEVYAVHEALAIALIGGILAVRSWRTSDCVGLRVALFLLLGPGSVVGMLFLLLQQDSGSLTRVVTPFVLIALLVLLATKRYRLLIVSALAVNLLVAPAFLTFYREQRGLNFHADAAKLERFRQVAAASLHFDPARNPWCNSLLVPHYPSEVVAVPPGIGLGVIWDIARVQPPLKTHYLLLDDVWLGYLSGRVRLQEIAQTEVGTIYLNLDADCR